MSRLGINSNVTMHLVPLNDVWFRDNGPIFIKQGDHISFVKWDFNAWGQKFKWDLDKLAPFHVAKYLNIDHFNPGIVMEGGSRDVNGKGEIRICGRRGRWQLAALWHRVDVPARIVIDHALNALERRERQRNMVVSVPLPGIQFEALRSVEVAPRPVLERENPLLSQ